MHKLFYGGLGRGDPSDAIVSKERGGGAPGGFCHN